jgi:glucose/arabinose dehydrogenase
MQVRVWVLVVVGLLVHWPLAGCRDSDDGGGRDAAPPRADAGGGGSDASAADAAVAGFCQPTETENLGLALVVDGLQRPLFATAPANDPRLFVLEQQGTIRLAIDGALAPKAFLDITGRVRDLENEQGLLGLAFHPDYARNGRLFVHYTGSDDQTVIAEYAVSGDDPDVADRDSERIVLEVPQPQTNHNGGSIEFGPDGYLYIGLGDGGGANDPGQNGQNINTLLGTILRIDVDRDTPYAVPADNPFVGVDGADEVYHYGLRNPYRFSFDGAALYIGDVGQDTREEIDVYPADAPAGANFGWNIMEGSICRPGGGDCTPPANHVLPAAEYPHDGLACFSVTGGYVYRGRCLPSMRGRYFYADYCSPEVFSFIYAGGTATSPQIRDPKSFPSLVPPSGGISSFGRDGFGELYVIAFDARSDLGAVYRMVAAE